MCLKTTLSIWLKKIAYAFLILWVCGLTPLIYFEGFSSHFGKRETYHVNFLGQSERSQKLSRVLTEILEAQKESQKMSLLTSYADNLIGPNHTVATHFFLSIFNQSYLLVAVDALQNNLSLNGWVWALVLIGSSAWLPLPEKPPPFS